MPFRLTLKLPTVMCNAAVTALRAQAKLETWSLKTQILACNHPFQVKKSTLLMLAGVYGFQP